MTARENIINIFISILVINVLSMGILDGLILIGNTIYDWTLGDYILEKVKSPVLSVLIALLVKGLIIVIVVGIIVGIPVGIFLLLLTNVL